MMKNKKFNKKGFTLLEILVTVLIIAILSGIAIPNYMRAVEKTKLITHIPLLLDVQKGLVLYYAQNGYPASFRKLPISITNTFVTQDSTAGSAIRAVSKNALCEIKFTPANDILEYACKNSPTDGSFGATGWKFELPFNNNAGGLVENGKFFVITAADDDRKQSLTRLALSSGWKMVESARFEMI